MRTAVVLSAAMPLTDEEQLVARRVAGVLVGAGAELLVAEPAEPAWQIGLPARRFPVAPARRARRALLEATFKVGTVVEQRGVTGAIGPATAAAEDAWLDAGGGSSQALTAALDDGFERLVLVGLSSRVAMTTAERWGGPCAVVPLRTPPIERLPRARRIVRAADAVLAVGDAERRAIEAVGARGAVDVGFALRVEETGGERPFGAPDGPYVLAVGEWSDPIRGNALRRRAARFARRLSTRRALPVVLLTDGYLREQEWPGDVIVRVAGSRRDLWGWMRSAVAVVDLDRSRYLARDAAESLLCGVPAVVPAGGAAHDVVESCGGGLWYRSLDDAAVAVDALVGDRQLGSRLGGQGRDAALQRFDLDTFTNRVLEAAVLQPAGR